MVELHATLLVCQHPSFGFSFPFFTVYQMSLRISLPLISLLSFSFPHAEWRHMYSNERMLCRCNICGNQEHSGDLNSSCMFPLRIVNSTCLSPSRPSLPKVVFVLSFCTSDFASESQPYGSSHEEGGGGKLKCDYLWFPSRISIFWRSESPFFCVLFKGLVKASTHVRPRPTPSVFMPTTPCNLVAGSPVTPDLV